jgi:hypothetical protein
VIAYKSTIIGISGRSEKLEPLLSKISDTALAELRTTMVLPRTLREMISSPAVENDDTQVSAESSFQGKEVYQTGETNPDISHARRRSQGQASSQGQGDP